MNDFTHFNENGRAKMVDVSEKSETSRTAVAAGRVRMNRETFALVKSGGMKKGDVLGAAQIAGIMAAKRTPDLIPMCHTLLLSGVDMAFELNDADCAVDHQFMEFIQIHVQQVGDAIQPSHSLSSPSPLAPNPSQHQSLFQ